MNDHIGYEKHDQTSREKSSNYRKGNSTKNLKSTYKTMPINVPHDDASLFKPKIIKKYQTDISALMIRLSLFVTNVYLPKI